MDYYTISFLSPFFSVFFKNKLFIKMLSVHTFMLFTSLLFEWESSYTCLYILLFEKHLCICFYVQRRLTLISIQLTLQLFLIHVEEFYELEQLK